MCVCFDVCKESEFQGCKGMEKAKAKAEADGESLPAVGMVLSFQSASSQSAVGS
jgi:hypothetical protein